MSRADFVKDMEGARRFRDENRSSVSGGTTRGADAREVVEDAERAGRGAPAAVSAAFTRLLISAIWSAGDVAVRPPDDDIARASTSLNRAVLEIVPPLTDRCIELSCLPRLDREP
jgi:hypothetical protein